MQELTWCSFRTSMTLFRVTALAYRPIQSSLFCRQIIFQTDNCISAVPPHTYGGVRGGEEVLLLFIHDLGARWGEWSASRPGRALPSGKEPPVAIRQETGWAPEPVWTQKLEEKSSDSAGDQT
jgi:hypothetical protein